MSAQNFPQVPQKPLTTNLGRPDSAPTESGDLSFSIDPDRFLIEPDRHALTTDEIKSILDWWRDLSDHPAAKQELRNITDPILIISHPEAIKLRSKLNRWSEPPVGVALLAGLLSQVDEYDPEMRFICRLGRHSEGCGPALSEIHFLRLSSASNAVEFYRRIKRAVLVLRRAVDIPSVADCALNWAQAHPDASKIDETWRRGLQDRWRTEYCSAR